MEFFVKGNIKATKRSNTRSFGFKVSAKSKKHAESIAISKIGSAQSIKKNRIEILSVEEENNAKR